MRKALGIMTTLAAILAVNSAAEAQLTVTDGKIIILFADPSDLVIQLDKTGRCGSAYFHVQRSAVNFKEMAAIAMTGFGNDKTMAVFVKSCVGDRNILSHGYIVR